MANEAVIIELLGNAGDPISCTCADGTGIAKGTLLQLTDARVASAHSAADEGIIGIAAMEKVASDGSTTISVYTNLIVDITAAAGGVTAVGHLCAASATANMIQAADAADILQGSVVGMCLEAQANDEVGAVRILK